MDKLCSLSVVWGVGPNEVNKQRKRVGKSQGFTRPYSVAIVVVAVVVASTVGARALAGDTSVPRASLPVVHINAVERTVRAA